MYNAWFNKMKIIKDLSIDYLQTYLPFLNLRENVFPKGKMQQ